MSSFGDPITQLCKTTEPDHANCPAFRAVNLGMSGDQVLSCGESATGNCRRPRCAATARDCAFAGTNNITDVSQPRKLFRRLFRDCRDAARPVPDATVLTFALCPGVTDGAPASARDLLHIHS